MKSLPLASAKRASRRQSGQLADQRSGTIVAERPDEQLAPNSPSLSWLALNIAMRSGMDAVRGDNRVSIYFPRPSLRGSEWRVANRQAGPLLATRYSLLAIRH